MYKSKINYLNRLSNFRKKRENHRFAKIFIENSLLYKSVNNIITLFFGVVKYEI